MSRNSSPQCENCPEPQLAVFVSDLGWFGVVGIGELSSGKRVTGLTFGHRTPGEVHERLRADGIIDRLTTPVDWWPDLRERLQAYAAGSPDDFVDITAERLNTTSFQDSVISALNEITYGQTLSYADLAERAGSPRAARAVGTVMSSNPIPILIPCHRVVGSGGRLGGYSAPDGVSMKQRLLDLEAANMLAVCK